MKYVAAILALLFCSFGHFCFADTPIEKEYIFEADLLQTDNGLFYFDEKEHLVPITKLYMDEEGFYILNVDYNRWNCRCCGYDLNIKKDYCAKCKGSRWWCE